MIYTFVHWLIARCILILFVLNTDIEFDILDEKITFFKIIQFVIQVQNSRWQCLWYSFTSDSKWIRFYIFPVWKWIPLLLDFNWVFFCRECPFSLESIQGLLSLGVKGADVAALVMNGLPHGSSCDWLVYHMIHHVTG